MQTFLPYESFGNSAKVLDDKRLGKQRIEAYMILERITGRGKGWHNHPAVLMWAGYPFALKTYGIIICREWISRGHRDTMLEKFESFVIDEPGGWIYPLWLGGPIHASHRANLLRKDPEFYGEYGWTEDPGMPYFWPVRKPVREEG